jgi:hypothetical protein
LSLRGDPAVIVAPVATKVTAEGLFTAEVIARALVDEFLLARLATLPILLSTGEHPPGRCPQLALRPGLRR